MREAEYVVHRATGNDAMRVLVIENCYGATMGALETALVEAGAEIDIRQVHAGEPLPASARTFDGLIILGGIQNALDDEKHPELALIAGLAKAFHAADKPVLGICLGAQIIARAFGGRNILGRPIEFGWHRVETNEAGRDDPVLSAMGEGAPVFQWHNDTFELPPGAIHLARNDDTENQAFRLGRATYGFQFHFEADRKLVRQWCDVLADEIAGHTPDWALRHEAESARHGTIADAVGLDIARNWISLMSRS